jgi:hypothetical protein
LAFCGNLSALLRGVVFVGKTPLGTGFNPEATESLGISR